MRAVVFDHLGSLDDLRVVERPEPRARPNEVLVRVDAAAVNPSDVKNVEGAFSDTTLPRTPGRDFAGTVEAGPSEMIGWRVWGTFSDLGFTRDGTHADFVVIPADGVARRPDGLSPEQAAAVPVAFLTAWWGIVEAARIRAGETALIVGVSGAVGSAATQLVHWRGGRVVGVDRRPPADETPRAALPDAFVAADAHDLADQVRVATNGRGAELGLDTVGGPAFESHLASLADRGRLAVISSVGERRVSFDLIDFYHKRLTLIGVDSRRIGPGDSARVLDQLASAFDAGALVPPVIAATYSLDEVRGAYEAVKGGTLRGKVVLRPHA